MGEGGGLREQERVAESAVDLSRRGDFVDRPRIVPVDQERHHERRSHSGDSVLP